MVFGVRLLRARIRDKGVDQGGLLLRQEGLGNLHLKIIRGFTFPYRKEREGRCKFFVKKSTITYVQKSFNFFYHYMDLCKFK